MAATNTELDCYLWRLLAAVLLACDVITAAQCPRRFSDASGHRWHDYCFGSVSNFPAIDDVYKDQNCAYRCEQIDSCLFYTVDSAQNQCYRCLYNYTDLEQHGLREESYSAAGVDIGHVRLRRAHEVRQAAYDGDDCVTPTVGDSGGGPFNVSVPSTATRITGES